MKNYSFNGVLLLLVLLATGCSNEKLPTEVPESQNASYKEGPAFMKYSESSPGGPLFDLFTAPNNDILVADASVGITTLYGKLEAALPGVTSVSTVGRGNMWATVGPNGPGEEDNGQALYRVHKNRTEMVANLFEFEEHYNPDGQDINSNPYAVLALNGNEALVIDSGANDLLRVDQKGNIEIVAVFPNELVSTQHIKDFVGCPAGPPEVCGLPPMLPAQPVPTSVVIGPDGYYYVGELKGFPAPTGESNIWRISPDATGAMCGSSPDCVKAFDGGFTSIIDMDFGKNGILYVAEMDAKSWLAAEFGFGAGGTIKACNPQTLQCEVIASGIPLLTAITIDKKDNLWATRNALVPGEAEVVQITF